MTIVRPLRHWKRSDRHATAIVVVLCGVALGIVGWGAALTTAGCEMIVAGSTCVIAAVVLRPTWRFILCSLLVLYRMWDGLLYTIAWLVSIL